MKKIYLKPRSFEHTKVFPGCTGNPFDRVLYGLVKIDYIPTIIIFLLLAFYAILGSMPQIFAVKSVVTTWGITFFSFLLLDWILLRFLQVLKLSFGPDKTVLLMLATLRLPFALLPSPINLVLQIIGTLLVVYAFYLEPFRIHVRHENFSPAKWMPGQSLRVLHFGDLHIERATVREKKLLKMIHSLAPDLILFSGDVLNLSYLEDPLSKADAISFFKELNAPLGVYGVMGSPAVDSQNLFASLVENTLLNWLNNEVRCIPTPSGNVNLIGLTCSHNPDVDEKVLASLEIPEEGFNLLLYHSPDLAPNASRHPIDLQLSGHTHAGQIRLPALGALFTGSLYGRTFESGRYLVNDMTLSITRGLGMEGAAAPRVRFLASPEITMWQIASS